MNGGIIRNNRTTSGGGGGVFLITSSRFYMNDGLIEGNEAPSTHGGGVHLNSASVMNMSNGRIANNRANMVGGGVCLSSANTGTTFNITGGIIEHNVAGQRGGGVSWGASGLYGEISGNAIIRYNTAMLNGGGIEMALGTTVVMSGNALITGNTAVNGYGGGVMVSFTGFLEHNTFTMESGTISNNTAALDGGGIYTSNFNYSNPLAAGPGVFCNLTIYPGTIFFGNRARSWFEPPLIPTGVNNQLPNILWLPATGSSVPHPTNAGEFLYLLNNYDINFAPPRGTWYLGNIPYWPMFKTCMEVYDNFANRVYLAGAVFNLFVFNGDGTPASEFITAANIGPGANEWTLVTTRTSTITGVTPDPMLFPMQWGFYYQLVEVLPPVGFQHPIGQWRMQTRRPADTPGINDPTTNWIYWGRIGVAPGLHRQHLNQTVYHIGNRVDFMLPLTGGLGTYGFVFAGTGFLIAAIAVVGIYVFSVKRKKLRNTA